MKYNAELNMLTGQYRILEDNEPLVVGELFRRLNLHDRLVEALEKAEIEIDRLMEALEDALPFLPNTNQQFDEGDPDPAGKIERLLAEAKEGTDEN